MAATNQNERVGMVAFFILGRPSHKESPALRGNECLLGQLGSFLVSWPAATRKTMATLSSAGGGGNTKARAAAAVRVKFFLLLNEAASDLHRG